MNVLLFRLIILCIEALNLANKNSFRTQRTFSHAILPLNCDRNDNRIPAKLRVVNKLTTARQIKILRKKTDTYWNYGRRLLCIIVFLAILSSNAYFISR